MVWSENRIGLNEGRNHKLIKWLFNKLHCSVLLCSVMHPPFGDVTVVNLEVGSHIIILGLLSRFDGILC